MANDVRVYRRVEELVASEVGKKVWVRGRVTRAKKTNAALCFLILRQKFSTVQIAIEESSDIPRAMVNWTSKYALACTLPMRYLPHDEQVQDGVDRRRVRGGQSCASTSGVTAYCGD